MTGDRRKTLGYVVEAALIFLVLSVVALVGMGVYAIYDLIFN